MRTTNSKSKFRPGYSGTIHGLFYKNNRSPTMNYCLFNEIGSQAKTNKKTMLPLKLSITGLYSYQKKQTIDFEELTNAGLFGILEQLVLENLLF
jgi:hypothetical protein